MHREISFWLMIGGIVLTAIGAANPIHGTYFELAGIACIFGVRETAKRGW